MLLNYAKTTGPIVLIFGMVIVNAPISNACILLFDILLYFKMASIIVGVTSHFAERFNSPSGKLEV